MNSKFIGKLCLPPPLHQKMPSSLHRGDISSAFASSSQISSVGIRNLTSYHVMMSESGDGSCQGVKKDRESKMIKQTTNTPLHKLSSSSSSSSPLSSLQIATTAIRKRHRHPVLEAEPEVDTRDSLPTRKELHKGIIGRSNSPNGLSHSRKPKLTLSAYRRPEQTVRLTDCDSSRFLENEYNLRAQGCQVIGHGAFSTVRSAIRISDGSMIAIKSISKYNALRSSSNRKHMGEWEIMKLMKDNPNVLTLFDVFETDEEIHLVTELCEGGELFNSIKAKGSKRSSYRSRGRYTEPQAARITHQILRALMDLHAHGIVHRDIKAENILLLNKDESDVQVKLCDFGVARRTSCEDYGTPTTDGEYSPSIAGENFTTNSPPEACKGACGPASDVYSLGVTLYTILCGFPPVFCESKVVFPDAYWNDISNDAKSLLRSMLHPDPHQRVTAPNALLNPWVRQQTMRVRSGSISANLELVRSRLIKEEFSPRKKRRRTSRNPKRVSRRISSATTLTISLAELYSEQRDTTIHLIDNFSSEEEMCPPKHSIVRAPKIIC